jgi:carboxymethylenebutenolidase
MRLPNLFVLLLLLVGCAAGPEPDRTSEGAPTAHTVTYSSGNDRIKGILYSPPGEGRFPAVVVVHGDFGLTGWVKDRARRLAERGYIALAVDLYRGERPGDLMDAHIMDRGLPEDRVLADLKAAVNYLARRADVRRGRLGIIGWDMGGGYALDAALHDRRLRAVVTCYGRLVTDARLLSPLRASVLGIFGSLDEGISADTIGQFRTAMRKAGKRVAGLHIYAKCGHDFMTPESSGAAKPAVARATADAWNKIEEFLAGELQR